MTMAINFLHKRRISKPSIRDDETGRVSAIIYYVFIHLNMQTT